MLIPLLFLVCSFSGFQFNMSDASDSENPSNSDYASASSTSYSTSSPSSVSLSSDEESRAFAETRTKYVDDFMSGPAVIPISSDEGSSEGDPSSSVNTGPAPTVLISDLSRSYRQTLRELRHACLARAIRMDPPPSDPPGLEVQPLSE